MPNSYVNRNGFFAINLQGLCDQDKLFLNCYVGEVGSVHNALVFKRSSFYKKMIRGEIEFVDNGHILGDNAYPISEHVLTPYPRSVNTRKSKRFNKELSQSRVIIEQAFDLLKGRFRRLKYFENKVVENVPKVIVACCILHNIAIIENDWDWVTPDDGTRLSNTNVLSQVPPEQIAAQYRSKGQAKRNKIADSFMHVV